MTLSDLQHQDSNTVGMHVVLVLVTNDRQYSDLRIVPYTNEMFLTPITETVRQTTITCAQSMLQPVMSGCGVHVCVF